MVCVELSGQTASGKDCVATILDVSVSFIRFDDGVCTFVQNRKGFYFMYEDFSNG